MQNLPFDKPGRFWRGNIHTHSTRSDGRLSPAAVCERYREAGYDFISLTDHFMRRFDFPITNTTPYRTDDFTTILGAELHTEEDKTEFGSVWHILAVGLPANFPPPSSDETGPTLAQRALATGAYVAVAHPHWYALTESDVNSLGQLDAIEIFNGVAADDNDHADSWHMADIMLGRGKRYTTCATDDFHAKPGNHDFARGWVQVKSETLEPNALLAALKAGAYYSSTGPEIYDIQLYPGDKVIVRCSPVTHVMVTGIGSTRAYDSGHGKVHFEVDISGFRGRYCRVTVRDKHGERAWSNPIWLE